MKNSPSVGQLGEVISHFFRRYHMSIFLLTVVIGVSAAVLLLNGLLSKSNEMDPTVTTQSSSFDKKTIERIDNFSPAGAGKDDFSLPSGRTNPFVE